MKPRLVVLGFLIIFASFLRLRSLTAIPNGLYWDEIDVGYQALSLLQTGKDYHGNPLPLFLHSLADYREPVFLYSAVPLIAMKGFTAYGIRLVPVMWGILGVIAMYVLGQKLFKAGLLTGFVAAASMWLVQYSRVAQEPIAMMTCLVVAVACWLGHKQRKWQIFSLLFFALAIASYSTAKLFVPLFMVCIFIGYRPKKVSLVALGLFLLIAGPIYLDGIFGKSGMRFHDVAVYTDPTIASEIDSKRLDSQIGLLGERSVGMSPSLLDKFSYNKPEEVISQITKNYLSAFSIDFLFIKGDRELRHSPSKSSIGMLYVLEIVPLICGLYILTKTNKSKKILFTSWLLLSPIPASLTRNGSAHASRLIVLAIPLLLLVAVGFKYLFTKSKFATITFSLLLLLTITHTYYYYFTRYSLESLLPFQWGYDQMAREAIDRQKDYSYVLIDAADDSALMGYLYETKMSPRKFQELLPLKNKQFADNIFGWQFDNIILLQPGGRHWTDFKPKETVLVVSSAKQPLLDKYEPKLKTIRYPDGTDFFYVFERNRP